MLQRAEERSDVLGLCIGDNAEISYKQLVAARRFSPRRGICCRSPPAVLPCSEVVDRSESGQETVLEVLGGERGDTEVAPERVQLQVEEHNGSVRVREVELLNVGKLLSGGDDYYVHVDPVDGRDGAGFGTQQVEENLLGLEDTSVIGVAAAEAATRSEAMS